jgi:hypothetical protein
MPEADDPPALVERELRLARNRAVSRLCPLRTAECLRRSRVRFMNQVLAQLGLGSAGSPAAGSRRARPKPAKTGSAASKQLPRVGARRSSRSRSPAAAAEPAARPGDVRTLRAKRSQPAAARLTGEQLEPGEAGLVVQSAPGPPARSSMDVLARVEMLRGPWVGRVFLPPPDGGNSMKACVMNAVGREAPRFSKYSGLQRFKNCALLFVNVGGDTYENLFRPGEEAGELCMDWFAQDRMHRETPAVLDLAKPDAQVFLFLRVAGAPYLCCGPLGLVAWHPATSPVKFQWRIEQVQALRALPQFLALTG